MPALPQNTSNAHVLQPPSTGARHLEESSLQTLLFDTLTVLLAAASFVVATLHFIHQKREKARVEQHQPGTFDTHFV